MTRLSFGLFAIVVSLSPGFQLTARAADSMAVPPFNQVYELILTNLPGISDAELNRAAVAGLLDQLRGKASIVSDANAATESNAPLASRAGVLDDGVAYVRVSRVGVGLAGELSAAWARLSSTNKLTGLALDLRFADGDDYVAAAAAADLFVAKERVLLDWGAGVARSTAKADAITLPVAVLVNRQTSGAAEALAAVLREAGAGLLIGAVTAGNAMIAKEFPLKTGQQLRVATLPVKLGEGSALSTQGVKPDIEVAVKPDAERAYFEDAYAAVSKPATNSTIVAAGQIEGTNRPSRRPRISEADLVRERREGTNDVEKNATESAQRQPEKPVIRDPVLARAVDLLKGLAVVRGQRS